MSLLELYAIDLHAREAARDNFVHAAHLRPRPEPRASQAIALVGVLGRAMTVEELHYYRQTYRSELELLCEGTCD